MSNFKKVRADEEKKPDFRSTQQISKGGDQQTSNRAHLVTK